jgi:hypothetical protein
MWIKFFTGDVHKYLLSYSEFPENQRSEIYTLVELKEFVSIPSAFIVQSK